MTGIYRIKNINNGKSYIGQSKNIYQRWKQHTSGLNPKSDETIIRKAFVKYGLFQQVSREGEYGKFRFEIIEECNNEMLLEREYFFINQEKPEYNLMLSPPNQLLCFNSKRKQHFGKYFIQYHNYDKEKHFPGITEENLNSHISDSVHYISTRKNIAAYLDGANVVLIIGVTVNKKKKYYIWTRTSVDELDFIEEEDLPYNIIGFQDYIKPVCLNDIPGFREFQKRLGNFAYGLSSISKFGFSEKIIEICETKQADDKILCKDFLELYKNEFCM